VCIFSIWDTVPVATQKQTQTTLLECIERIALRGDSTEGEKNSLCKTVAFLHEMDITRGHAWPALETCLQRLVSDEKSTRDQQDLYYKFLYENPAMVADAPIPDLIRNLINGLQAISSPNHLSISSIEAAVAVLQVDDRAVEMLDVVPNILDVRVFVSEVR
jgi:hypothetical protein